MKGKKGKSKVTQRQKIQNFFKALKTLYPSFFQMGEVRRWEQSFLLMTIEQPKLFNNERVIMVEAGCGYVNQIPTLYFCRHCFEFHARDYSVLKVFSFFHKRVY